MMTHRAIRREYDEAGSVNALLALWAWMPARWSACRMIDPMAHWLRKPRIGALVRRNTRRPLLRGRPWRRYAAIASPTSAGRGSAVR